jgi:hypothetical protein
MESVAVIGAGVGGLVSARWLLEQGFEPVIFDQGNRVGGQWTRDPRYSGIWASMRANTSKYTTSLSDVPPPADTPPYMHNEAVRAYLQDYAERFDLIRRLRLGTRVEEVAPEPNGDWRVRVAGPDGARHEDIHQKVVVASGRYHRPSIPSIPGLQGFSGHGGVSHTFAYREPERFRGLRVLVAGCSISALEIASELAMSGAANVVTTHRRQRYILQKLLAGVPADLLVFNRFSALAAECFAPDQVARALRDFITSTTGSPDQFGAPKPADNVFQAGIALSQHYLPLVSEGRIEVRAWIAGVDGTRVTFADGQVLEFDAIVLGTGYAVDVPFLPQALRAVLQPDGGCLELFRHTFHPETPGLAFVGLVQIIGPGFPLEELQARWISYAWSGERPAPSREEMLGGLEAARARGHQGDELPLHVGAVMFARAAGVEPDVTRWPQLARALLFGPLTPVSFRLDGPHSLPNAADRVAAEGLKSGAVPTPELTPDQCARLRALGAARQDPAFLSFVEKVTASPSAAA